MFHDLMISGESAEDDGSECHRTRTVLLELVDGDESEGKQSEKFFATFPDMHIVGAKAEVVP